MHRTAQCEQKSADSHHVCVCVCVCVCVQRWYACDYIRVPLASLLVLIMALFGSLVTLYCIICFSITAVGCVPVMDFRYVRYLTYALLDVCMLWTGGTLHYCYSVTLS